MNLKLEDEGVSIGDRILKIGKWAGEKIELQVHKRGNTRNGGLFIFEDNRIRRYKLDNSRELVNTEEKGNSEVIKVIK